MHHACEDHALAEIHFQRGYTLISRNRVSSIQSSLWPFWTLDQQSIFPTHCLSLTIPLSPKIYTYI
jgi:hypothetical protein